MSVDYTAIVGVGIYCEDLEEVKQVLTDAGYITAEDYEAFDNDYYEVTDKLQINVECLNYYIDYPCYFVGKQVDESSIHLIQELKQELINKGIDAKWIATVKVW